MLQAVALEYEVVTLLRKEKIDDKVIQTLKFFFIKIMFVIRMLKQHMHLPPVLWSGTSFFHSDPQNYTESHMVQSHLISL